jgi:RimJ/RimL family protein N-acetyltransferase
MTDVVKAFTAEMFATRPALVRIEAKVFTYNPASARVCEKAGFLCEGIARKLHYKNGVYIDAFMLALLRAE